MFFCKSCHPLLSIIIQKIVSGDKVGCLKFFFQSFFGIPNDLQTCFSDITGLTPLDDETVLESVISDPNFSPQNSDHSGITLFISQRSMDPVSYPQSTDEASAKEVDAWMDEILSNYNEACAFSSKNGYDYSNLDSTPRS